jgi:hypothetical protein
MNTRNSFALFVTTCLLVSALGRHDSVRADAAQIYAVHLPIMMPYARYLLA